MISAAQARELSKQSSYEAKRTKAINENVQKLIDIAQEEILRAAKEGNFASTITVGYCEKFLEHPIISEIQKNFELMLKENSFIYKNISHETDYMYQPTDDCCYIKYFINWG